MDILVAALYLEVDDNDYNYMSMVLQNARVQLASTYSSDTEDLSKFAGFHYPSLVCRVSKLSTPK